MKTIINGGGEHKSLFGELCGNGLKTLSLEFDQNRPNDLGGFRLKKLKNENENS